MSPFSFFRWRNRIGKLKLLVPIGLEKQARIQFIITLTVQILPTDHSILFIFKGESTFRILIVRLVIVLKIVLKNLKTTFKTFIKPINNKKVMCMACLRKDMLDNNLYIGNIFSSLIPFLLLYCLIILRNVDLIQTTLTWKVNSFINILHRIQNFLK